MLQIIICKGLFNSINFGQGIVSILIPHGEHHGIGPHQGQRQSAKEPELHNVNVFTQTQIVGSKFTPKTRKSQLVCFRDKMRKILVCVLIQGHPERMLKVNKL